MRQPHAPQAGRELDVTHPCGGFMGTPATHNVWPTPHTAQPLPYATETAPDGNMGAAATATQTAVRLPQPSPPAHTFVRTETGQTVTLNDVIKRQVHSKKGIPPDQQRLVFAGKNDHTLADYGVEAHSTLELLVHLRGGMPAKGDTAMAPSETVPATTAANSSLLAWPKWVQGPYQALPRSAHSAQQLDKWEFVFLRHSPSRRSLTGRWRQ